MANNYQEGIDKAKQDIDELQGKLIAMQNSILENAKQFNAMLGKGSGSMKQTLETVSKVTKEFDKLNETKKQSIVVDGQIKVKQSELAKSMQALNEQRKKANSERLKEADAIERNKQALQKQKKASIELSRAYVQLVNQQKQAKKTLQDLIVSQGKNSAQTRKAQKEYDTLTKKVNQANKATSNFSKTGLGSMARGFRNLVSAFGVTSGIYIFANSLKNAFNRVRDFDKSMQNLAGVFRTTREELKPLEEDIVNVAGQSIKTSREVADLAESLATLGKTPKEIRKLLKPVVDLGIGLETSSENAGEFLIQMLNAFGASEDEATKYADTIATIRTSTTLDFQKMRDSFQYIAPIAKLLNKDLAYTGSVVGILADNGLKAQQAGRVLGTSLQKLAAQGKTLDDALDEINEATSKGVKETDLLALSNKLFGAEGSKVGVILANNRDLIDSNSKAIRENSGALDDLVKQQMESLDAKLLVLDASWERLILKVDNGNGVFSKTFKTAVEGATDLLNVLTDINEVTSIIGDGEEISLWQKIFPAAGVRKGFSDFTRLRDATREFQEIQKEYETIDLTNIKEVQSGIDIWTDMKKEVEGNVEVTKILDFFIGKLQESETSYYESARDEDDAMRKRKLKARKGLEEEGLVLESLRKKLNELKEDKKSLGKVELLKNSDYEKWEELTKSIKETENSINNLTGAKNKGHKSNVKYLKETLAYYQAQISLAKDSLKNTAKTKEEYEDITDEIKNAEDALDSFIRKQLGIGDKGEIKGVELPEIKGIDFSDIESTIDYLNSREIDIPVDTTEIDKLIKRLVTVDIAQNAFKDVTDTFSDMFDIDTSKFDFIFDSLKDKSDELFSVDKLGEWADLSKELIGSVLDASMQRYEIELNEAARVRDLTLNNDLASEEAKAKARKKYDKEERKIKKEQAKAEKENTLIKIAMDTAAAVVSIWAQVPKFDYGISAGVLSAATIALGAVQAGIVASQPIPEFFDGVENSSYEGLATKDERGAELHLDKYGNIKDFGQDGGAKYTYVEKGDTIIPAMKTKDILSSFSDEDINRVVFEMNMSSMGSALSENVVDNSLLREISSLKDSNEKVWKEVKKLASRPLNINNKIELKDDRAY